MIFVISMLDSTNTTSFGLSKKKFFFPWYLRGTPGTKTVKISFSRIKSKNMIRDFPWFKPDRNKWILKGAEKWPYPPSSFSRDFKKTSKDFNRLHQISTDCTELHGTSRDFMELHETSSDFQDFRRLQDWSLCFFPLVHKQTACWLLTDKASRLSADRLSRVIETSKEH